MSYLIQFRFGRGQARQYIRYLTHDVAKRFEVTGATRSRPVPHVTLFGPFNTRYEAEMVAKVANIATAYRLVPFQVKGFGYFDNIKTKVIYLEITPSRKLKKLRWELSKGLRSGMADTYPVHDVQREFHFHATIAFKDIDRKFSEIWNYLMEKKESPSLKQHLLRITILENGKILYEYDLMQRKLLNRKAALSRENWNRTIEIFKRECRDFLEDAGAPRNV